jgi:antitoxin HicB
LALTNAVWRCAKNALRAGFSTPLDMHQIWCINRGMATTLTRQTEREAFTIKRELSGKLNAQIRWKKTSKASLARDLGTSRTAIDRVLDPKNTSITLRTLVRAANSLGYKIKLSLEPRIDKIEPVPTPPALEPLMRQLGKALDGLPAR